MSYSVFSIGFGFSNRPRSAATKSSEHVAIGEPTTATITRSYVKQCCTTAKATAATATTTKATQSSATGSTASVNGSVNNVAPSTSRSEKYRHGKWHPPPTPAESTASAAAAAISAVSKCHTHPSSAKFAIDNDDGHAGTGARVGLRKSHTQGSEQR